jgi:hypothetical protein
MLQLTHFICTSGLSVHAQVEMFREGAMHYLDASVRSGCCPFVETREEQVVVNLGVRRVPS